MTVKVDTSSFDRAYRDYVSFSKKSLPEIANKVAFEVAKISTTTTKITPKEQIASELNKAGNNGAPIAALIVNRDRKAKGKKGLFGERMQKAMETLIKKRQRGSKFVASGWIAAVKAMAPFVRAKGGAPMPTGKAKSSLGGAQGARNVMDRVSASIWNNVLGGKGAGSKPARVTEVEKQGLAKAISLKQADMLVYIQRKLNEGAQRFNRG